MKYLLLCLLVPLSVFAQEDCDPAESGLSSAVVDPALEALAGKEKEFKVVSLRSVSDKQNLTEVEYRLAPEQKLNPGECAYFSVPKELQDKPVFFVILGHRQDPSEDTGRTPGNKYDNNPGLTSLQVNVANSGGEPRWRYWHGQASGNMGAKFAEPGYSPEIEGLYEWYDHGHSDIKTDATSKDPLKTDAIRLCSIGKDPVRVSSLKLKVFPGYAKEYKEFNFGEGNVMGDSLTASGRQYGELKGSVVLGHGPSTATLPAGWTQEGSRVRIPLPKGKEVLSIEAAVSDTKAPTLGQHDDGDQTTSGWGRLNVYVQKKNGTRIPIVSNENVPPRGVITGSPEKLEKLDDGDELIVEGTSDKVYLLGLKLGLN